MPSLPRPGRPAYLPDDSLFRRNIRCSGNANSLFGCARELVRKGFKLLGELASAMAKAARICNIPCYFPCWQGIRRSRSPRRVPYPASGSRTACPLATARSIAIVVSRLMRACAGVVCTVAAPVAR
jgi:hypothetical protein